jgi:hypothetical protein
VTLYRLLDAQPISDRIGAARRQPGQFEKCLVDGILFLSGREFFQHSHHPSRHIGIQTVLDENNWI